MMPIARANSMTSPLGIDFTKLRFSKKAHRDSKNLGNMYRASSARLPAGSHRIPKVEIKAAPTALNLSSVCL
jgi:hypothetical protein